MTNVAECTVPEKILLAAYHIENHGESPFSAEALIVASWKKFPKAFGLKGFTELYPDANKVLTSIMGEKGLARRGWLEKLGQKLYSLTTEGKLVVKRLLQEEDAPPPPPKRQPANNSKLSRDQEKQLLNLLDSAGLEKYQQGLKLEMTFADACGFWGISQSLRGEALDERIDLVRASLTEINRVVGAKGADLSNGRSIAQDDLDLLREVDDYLSERFGRHLTLLRNRVER